MFKDIDLSTEKMFTYNDENNPWRHCCTAFQSFLKLRNTKIIKRSTCSFNLVRKEKKIGELFGRVTIPKYTRKSTFCFCAVEALEKKGAVDAEN